MEMADEGRNRDVCKLSRTNVLTSTSERQKEDQMRKWGVRQQTLHRGPNQTRTSREHYKAHVAYCGPKRTFGTSGGRPLFAVLLGR